MESKILYLDMNPFVGDKSKLQKMVQMAWTFVNDRYVIINLINSLISCNDYFYVI